MEEESFEEESWRMNHGGGVMEEESLRRNHGGDIWGAPGSFLGGIWESFGSHLGVIWETFGGLEAEEASGRHLEVRSHKLQYLSAKMQKFY